MLEVTQGSGQFGSSDLTTTIGVIYRIFTEFLCSR